MLPLLVGSTTLIVAEEAEGIVRTEDSTTIEEEEMVVAEETEIVEGIPSEEWVISHHHTMVIEMG